MEITAQQEARIISCIRTAGQKLLEFWNGKAADGTLEKKNKDDGSVVTEADYASNEILMSFFSKEFPGDAILSEEIPWDPIQDGKRRMWVIDPLDGTRSFVDKRDDFSILVGLTVDHQVVFGVMYFPVRDVLAVAQKGHGLRINGELVKNSFSKILRREKVLAVNHFSFRSFLSISRAH